jgi:hypothetical protein
MCFRWPRSKPKKFDRPFECACDLCGENFDTMETLIKHLGRHDIEDINRNVMDGRGTARCVTCHKSFMSVAAMEEHPCVPVIEGLSPIGSCDSLETVLIHDTYSQSDNHNN